MLALPPDLGNLAKLKELYVLGCHQLRALPDGMDGLTSLEALTIRECPKIQKFPEGLLQRVPTLTEDPDNRGLPRPAETLRTRWGVS